MTQAVQAKFDNLLGSKEFLDDPYPTYQLLRSEEPVFWSELWNCWIVTGYRDNVDIFKSPERFSNAGRYDSLFETLPPDVSADVEPLVSHYRDHGGIIHSDPPDHTRLRKLIHKVFTPATIREMTVQVELIVQQLLDAVQASGRMEVIHDFAYPLPATVVARMLGVPVEDISDFKTWSSDALVFQAVGHAPHDDVRLSNKALVAMKDYLVKLARQRRAEPKDDLMTALVQAEDAGDKLSENEMLSTCVTLMVAGHETTTNLIGNALFLLLDQPEKLEQLRSDRTLMASAVEEFLRYESPIQRNRRVIREDVEFRGKRMRKGQPLFQMLGAANRDPEYFTEPDVLDLVRNPNKHIAFGLGIHFCLGAPLARLEAPIALNAVLDRMPNLRLQTREAKWTPGVFRSLKSLPVTF